MYYYIINTLLSLVIIGSSFYGHKSGSDGYQMLSVSLFFYLLMGNMIFLAMRRRIKNEKSILLEWVLYVLMLYMGNSIIYFMKYSLCTFECFGVNTFFSEILLLWVSTLLFLMYFFLTTNKKQRIIGGIITLALLFIFLYDPVKYWYKETFIITRFPNSDFYFKDKKTAFCKLGFQDVQIAGSDPETFIAIDNNYAKDKGNVYFLCEQLIGVNPKTFSVFPGDVKSIKNVTKKAPEGFMASLSVSAPYSKDDTGVYYLGNYILGADANTFQVLGNGYAKDSSHDYFEGKIKK